MLSGLWFKVAIYAAVALFSGMAGYAISDTISARTIARMERDYANERTKAAEATAAAQAEVRRIETGWRDWVSQREREHAADTRVTAGRIAALAASAVGLQQRIADFTSPSITAADSCPAARDLQVRLKATGLLLTERDGMAGESEQVADELRDELTLCRGYAKLASPAP
jgi:hypothetical protein